jgi:carbonic anhydrase/acetyltransferase-like protein (isoleucine patch superfamily)
MPIVRTFAGIAPVLAPSVWLAENATVVGDVELGEDVNLWYGAVVRGDVGKARLGARCNVQDLACIHMTTDRSEAILEEDVTVGHGAIIHGAIVEAGVLVGMGAILMDNARIGAESIVGAGTLVAANVIIPPRSLVLGSPGRVVRTLTDEEAAQGRKSAIKYVGLARLHRDASDVPYQPPPTK